jgi:hypothetical protein
MKSANPFLYRLEEYSSIQTNILDYQNEIEAIKRDLESKVKMLLESRINYKKSMELKSKEILATCTHTNADDTPSIDKTHSDILTQIDDKLIKHSYCSLCGAKFKTGETNIDVIKKEVIINNTVDYMFDDEGDFVETISFDPNFDSNSFFNTTLDLLPKPY